MFEVITRMFDPSGFPPRKVCGTGWTPTLIWLHVTSDLFIWLAYVSIPLILIYFTRRRDLPFPRLFLLFAIFILSCGTTHLIDAILFEYPIYRFSAVMKLVTAIASWTTVIAMVPIIPRVMAAVHKANQAGEDTKLHRPLAESRSNRIKDYAIAVLVAVVALLLRTAIDAILTDDQVFVIALLAVVYVSWKCGFGPGVTCLVVCTVGYLFFFIPPRGSVVVASFGNQLAISLFFFCGVGCAALGESQRAAQRRAQRALATAVQRQEELEIEVTRRRMVEASLRQREQELLLSQRESAEVVARLNAFLDNAPLGIAFFGPDLHYVRINPHLAAANGKPVQDHIGRSLTDVLPDFPAEVVEAYRQVATNAGSPITTRIRRPERSEPGQFRTWQTIAFPVRGMDGQTFGAGVVAQDITDRLRAEIEKEHEAENLERMVQSRTADLMEEVEERKQAEAEVRKQRQFLDAVLSNVTEGIVACDEHGALTLFNRAAQEFHGLPAEVMSSDQWSQRYDLYCADEVTPMPGDDVPLLRAFRGERVRDAEMVIAPVGRPPRFLLANGERLLDQEGKCLGAVVSMRDMTEQRQADQFVREASAELHRANTELKRSNDELEKFAYIASHDLQEPLRKIQAFGDRLREKCRDQLPEVGQEYVDRMLSASSRMRRLIDDLLSFSRVTTQQREFRSLDLEKLVGEVISDLDTTIGQAGAAVTVGTLPEVHADPTQMRQLFQNLIANAVKFRRPGVPPIVEIHSEAIELPAPETNEMIAMCRIQVRDNGVGFDQKYEDRIFEVFQRLHGRDEYEGTGVGLAICRKIAERHGGTITVHSQEGVGSTFFVTLPIHHTPNHEGTD